MLPTVIIWACGGIMVICCAFLERRALIAVVAFAGTIIMGVTSNAAAVFQIMGAALAPAPVAPNMFVPATCTFGAIAVLAIYFTVAAYRGKLSRTACVISWAMGSWFVGFSYLIIGMVQLLDGE